MWKQDHFTPAILQMIVRLSHKGRTKGALTIAAITEVSHSDISRILKRSRENWTPNQRLFSLNMIWQYYSFPEIIHIKKNKATVLIYVVVLLTCTSRHVHFDDGCRFCSIKCAPINQQCDHWKTDLVVPSGQLQYSSTLAHNNHFIWLYFSKLGNLRLTHRQMIFWEI